MEAGLPVAPVHAIPAEAAWTYANVRATVGFRRKHAPDPSAPLPRARAADGASELAQVAGDAGWESGPERSVSVTWAIYLRLPPDAQLWKRGREFVEADPEALRAVLG